MLKFLPILLFLTLSACNAPSAKFRGSPMQTVTVDGSTFDVRVNGLFAEAIRTNMEYAPRMGPIGKRAAVAIERVSGCRVHSIGGDQAMVKAYLDCGNGPPKTKRLVLDFDCYSVDDYSIHGRRSSKRSDRDFTLNCDGVIQ